MASGEQHGENGTPSRIERGGAEAYPESGDHEDEFGGGGEKT